MPGRTVFSSSSTWWVMESTTFFSIWSYCGESYSQSRSLASSCSASRVLLLAVLDLVALAGRLLGDRVDLGLLGPAVGDEQPAEHRGEQWPFLRVVLQLVEQALHLAVVLHDQVDDVVLHGGSPW